jgi:hypothetical protein
MPSKPEVTQTDYEALMTKVGLSFTLQKVAKEQKRTTSPLLKFYK